MALTVDALLAPVSEDNPVGEDLSYDNDRASLETVFETSESSAGEEEAEQDWRSVLKQIEAQFGRSKDIWLAAYLCRAGARSGDLETVQTGAQVLAGLFEQYWPTVHPQLEELGFMGRKAPCDSLATRAGFLAPLQKAVLIAHPRLGRFSGADLERFRSEGASADGYGLFRAALEELGPDSLTQALARLDSIEDAFRRADKIFTGEAAGEPSPNFSVTYAALATLKQAVSAFMDEGGAAASQGDAPAAGGGGGGGAVATGGASFGGAVANRNDVVRALSAVADYYRRNEPGHPLQQLMVRAQTWVTLDFYSLMKEIAPDGVDQAEQVLKSRLEEDEDS